MRRMIVAVVIVSGRGNSSVNIGTSSALSLKLEKKASSEVLKVIAVIRRRLSTG